MYADLHIHSTASDGVLSPDKIVKQASLVDLKAIALADHDTTNGVKLAIEAGKKYGVEVIPAVEINTEYKEKEFHILGYYIDYSEDWFQNILSKLRLGRSERADKMLNLLAQIGKPISYTRLQAVAGEGAIGRPHIAKCLVEAGYVSSIKEAFEKLIGRDKPAYVPRFKLKPEEAVQIILRAKGIPILAHPGENVDISYLSFLISKGLLGIEAMHYDHSPKVEDRWKKVAQKYDLAITGGSDYHGGGRSGGSQVGITKIPYCYVENLKRLKYEAKHMKET